FAYYAPPVLGRMLDELGFAVTHGFLFDRYGGTVLLAARRHGVDGPRDPATVQAQLARESALGVTDPAVLAGLEDAARRSAEELRAHLVASRDAGRDVVGYAAASRAVPLLNRAGIGADLLPAVADGSPGKQGRRVPGVGIPIVAPDAVVERRPDEVVLFVTDMLGEMRRRMPEVEAGGSSWVIVDPTVRVVAPAG
ncbi:MAG TPA: methyltransferase C-terminal domain-containing protein, partial [Actinomycetospora sp.]|nr:methyltransferase C-terminal domain-containing protein [Actinomycetospora sp.]